MPLSYSQLQCYQRCPKQYEFAFVKKVPRGISMGESFGSSIHLALKKWGELEASLAPKAAAGQIALFTEESHGPEQKLDLHTLKTLWRHSFVSQGYESRAAQDSALLQGEHALEHFFSWWQTEKREVAACEKSFSVQLPAAGEKPAASIAGRFDRVERTDKGLVVIDFKSGQPRDQQYVDVDLQLSIYAAAVQQLWNEPAVELKLLFLGEEELIERVTTRNASQINDAMKIIRMLADDMESKNYKPSPSVEKCRHCPFREICPAKGL